MCVCVCVPMQVSDNDNKTAQSEDPDGTDKKASLSRSLTAEKLRAAELADSGAQTVRKSYDANYVSGPLPLQDAMLLTNALWKRPSSLGGSKAMPAAAKKRHVLSVDDDPVNQSECV